MRHVLSRKSPDTATVEDNVAEDSVPLPEARFAAVLSVNGRWIPVTLDAPPPRDSHAGTCTCEACLAAWLADSGIRFY